jgi:hypothetical protein
VQRDADVGYTNSLIRSLQFDIVMQYEGWIAEFEEVKKQMKDTDESKIKFDYYTQLRKQQQKPSTKVSAEQIAHSEKRLAEAATDYDERSATTCVAVQNCLSSRSTQVDPALLFFIQFEARALERRHTSLHFLREQAEQQNTTNDNFDSIWKRGMNMSSKKGAILRVEPLFGMVKRFARVTGPVLEIWESEADFRAGKEPKQELTLTAVVHDIDADHNSGEDTKANAGTDNSSPTKDPNGCRGEPWAITLHCSKSPSPGRGGSNGGGNHDSVEMQVSADTLWESQRWHAALHAGCYGSDTEADQRGGQLKEGRYHWQLYDSTFGSRCSGVTVAAGGTAAAGAAAGGAAASGTTASSVAAGGAAAGGAAAGGAAAGGAAAGGAAAGGAAAEPKACERGNPNQNAGAGTSTTATAAAARGGARFGGLGRKKTRKGGGGSSNSSSFAARPDKIEQLHRTPNKTNPFAEGVLSLSPSNTQPSPFNPFAGNVTVNTGNTGSSRSSSSTAEVAEVHKDKKGESDEDSDEDDDEEVDIGTMMSTKKEVDAKRRVDDRKNALKEKGDYQKASAAGEEAYADDDE